jgi:ectoine hydroxylase
MNRNALTDKEVRQYHEDGYLLLDGMLSKEELAFLGHTAREDKVLDQHSFGRADGEGGSVRLSLWFHPTDTIYGMIARSESLVSCAEKLLEGEVYHFSSKMIMKDAKVGGAWVWHQDYGYWYQNGLLYPLATSAFIAVDRATKENGCLQVIGGSHHVGRINHTLTGEQAGADPERVEKILERLQLVHVEMEPGDVLFFHPNLLHRSDQNRSEHPRWSMICSYNAARNNPCIESPQLQYTPLIKVPDEEILKAGSRRFGDSPSDAGWLDPADDHSASSLAKDP